MCSFDTTEADIDAFVAAIARETAGLTVRGRRAQRRARASPSSRAEPVVDARRCAPTRARDSACTGLARRLVARRRSASLGWLDGSSRSSCSASTSSVRSRARRASVAARPRHAARRSSSTTRIGGAASSTGSAASRASSGVSGRMSSLTSAMKLVSWCCCQRSWRVRSSASRSTACECTVTVSMIFCALARARSRCLAGADVRVRLDLLRLGAHEAVEVVGLGPHALRVLERRGDLVVRVLRDALGVGDGLVVQQQELLLRVVLAAGQRLLELERAHAQLAHGLFGLGAGERRLARDHRTQRRGALLGLAADRPRPPARPARPSRRRARPRARGAPGAR